MTITYYVQSGGLHVYQTGERLRDATPAEDAASEAAAESDGGAGVLTEDDLSAPIDPALIEAIEAELSA